MEDETELLVRFARERDEAAFAEVVRRNIDFVYGTALRHVNADAHLAEDVTQAVFLALAKKAGEVAGHRTPSGWLHLTTRFCASAAVRSERRWQKREQKAQAMIDESKPSGRDANWTELGPVLDEVLQEMQAADREAILMRYYENRPYADLGSRLGLTENTARMRVERALEKLRLRFARRGITSTAAALGAVLASQPAVGAPAALAAAVIQSALAGTAAAGIGTAAATTTLLMGTTKVIGTAAGIAALLAIGYYVGLNRAPDPAALETEAGLRRQVAQLRQENRGLVTETTRLRAAAEASTSAAAVEVPATAVVAPVPYNPATPARLDGNAAATPTAANAIMNNLRQIGAASNQFRLEKGRDPTSIDELVGPNAYIKALNVVDAESYANLDFSRNGTLMVTTASGVTVSYGSGSTPVKTPYQEATERARAAFLAASGGRSPVGFELAEYFDDPQFRDAFVDSARVRTIQQQLDPGLMPALEKAAKAFQASYRAAYGSPPPETFQAFEAIASFVENDDDRARYVATLRRIAGP